MNLADDWQNEFPRSQNLGCLTLYPSKNALDFLKKFSGTKKQSVSVAVRKAVDSYFQNKSWEVNVLPQAALKTKSSKQMNVYPFKEQIKKLKYLSSRTNRPVTHLVSEALREYCS